MSHPRFLFTARVVPTASGSEAGIAWRLVGGNNHELGRSAVSFPDFEACLASVELVRTHVEQFEVEPVASADSTEWGWRLNHHGETLAMSGRWYRRVREAEYNLHQFIELAPTADVSSVVGEPPPRRELLRPEFLLPHLPYADADLQDVVVMELADQDDERAGAGVADAADVTDEAAAS